LSEYLRKKKHQLLIKWERLINQAKNDYDTIEFGKPDELRQNEINDYIVWLEETKKIIETIKTD
jgi:hypothetical protein